jgi:hypothetical protein
MTISLEQQSQHFLHANGVYYIANLIEACVLKLLFITACPLSTSDDSPVECSGILDKRLEVQDLLACFGL